MSYGMHHYLMEKADQQGGMRKESGAITEGIKKGFGWLGGKLSKIPGASTVEKAGKKIWNQGYIYGINMFDYGLSPSKGKLGKLLRATSFPVGSFMLTHPKTTRAGILGLEGAGVAGVTGGGIYGINKALEKDSYIDEALELLNQYKGTAIGASAGIPTAIAAAAMSKPGSRLKNALLYGALASIIGGGAGYAYDKYNA